MNQGKVELDNIEKEFKYTKEHMGHIKAVVQEDFQNSKSRQDKNVRELLNQTGEKDVLVFTALRNPGQTERYQPVPVLLKRV